MKGNKLMIDKIIQDSYKKKIKIRKNIKIEEAEKSELFHKIKYENFKLSSLIYNKVKKANATINSNINNYYLIQLLIQIIDS